LNRSTDTAHDSFARTNINLYRQALNKVSFEEFGGVVAQVTDINVAYGAFVRQHQLQSEEQSRRADVVTLQQKSEPSSVNDISRFKSMSEAPGKVKALMQSKVQALMNSPRA
jgi:hypothetical protein